MLGVIKIFQIEKFLRDFVFSSIVLYIFRPSTCRFLINRFLIEKSVYIVYRVYAVRPPGVQITDHKNMVMETVTRDGVENHDE